MNISELCIRRPAMTVLLSAAVVVIGFVAYFQIPVAALPRYNTPVINVNAQLPGASPDTMASSVALPLEKQFSTIPGLQTISSVNTQGVTSVTLEFVSSRDIDAAAVDVQAALLRAQRQLPQELTQLPRFRRFLWFVSYGEGWALYAESLGDEMGFYKDPYQKFGNLAAEMWRACRLVVDTGIHAFGWTREQAIDYMVANTGQTRAQMTAEVDRYIVQPGQATAYKIGELKIKELRAKAKAELGDRFDLRRFHNAVIDDGAVPLQVLQAQIEAWIVAEKARER